MMRNVEFPPRSYMPQSFVKFNSGKFTAEQLLASCGDKLERADAAFHIAHRQLADGEVEAAKKNLRLMEQLNQYYHHEYRWARALLERIESDTNWPASIQLSSK